jgi:hypothetical protein
MEYGLFDTVDQCWLGDDKGPKTFTDRTLAQASAQMTCVQLGWPQDRVRPKPMPDGVNRHKDDMDLKMTPAEALRAIEDGRN